jgi:hypothetical protein
VSQYRAARELERARDRRVGGVDDRVGLQPSTVRTAHPYDAVIFQGGDVDPGADAAAAFDDRVGERAQVRDRVQLRLQLEAKARSALERQRRPLDLLDVQARP